MKIINLHPLVCLCVFAVSACGGGSESSSKSGSLAGPMQGYISIEERANKRVVDAWFSRGVVPENGDIALWDAGTERCVELNAVSFSENNSASHVGTRWRDTLFAGDSIRIESRSGEVARLLAQRYDGAVLYASTERWIAEPLPDDAQIMVTGSDEFPTFDAIPVSPLDRLIRTAPANGVTSDLSAAMTWEISEASDDKIELTVLASDSTEQGTRSVKCWLDDSGLFVMPVVVRQALPQNGKSVVTLVRTRDTTFDSGSAQLHVSQSSFP